MGYVGPCARSSMYCEDDSLLRSFGAPEGWLMSVCPATCGVCNAAGSSATGAYCSDDNHKLRQDR